MARPFLNKVFRAHGLIVSRASTVLATRVRDLQEEQSENEEEVMELAVDTVANDRREKRQKIWEHEMDVSEMVMEHGGIMSKLSNPIDEQGQKKELKSDTPFF